MLHADRFGIRKGLDFYINLVRTGRDFSFPKILHGFWEKLVFHMDCNAVHSRLGLLLSLEKANNDPEAFSIPYDIDHRRSPVYKPHADWYYRELLDLIAVPTPNLFLGIDHRGFPNDYNPAYPAERLLKVIEMCVPRGCTHYGLIWKESVINGKIVEFWDAIRPLPVVTVGLEHLADVGDRLGLDCRHIAVKMPIAQRIDRTVARIRAVHSRLGRAVYLTQLGGSAAAYLIYKLHGLPGATVIDMGRALDAWTPEGKSQLWFQEIPEDVKGRFQL